VRRERLERFLDERSSSELLLGLRSRPMIGLLFRAFCKIKAERESITIRSQKDREQLIIQRTKINKLWTKQQILLSCGYKKKSTFCRRTTVLLLDKKKDIQWYFSPREAFGRQVSWRGFVQILSASEPESLRPEKLSKFFYPREMEIVPVR
jgi:hypothetical protein